MLIEDHDPVLPGETFVLSAHDAAKRSRNIIDQDLIVELDTALQDRCPIEHGKSVSMVQQSVVDARYGIACLGIDRFISDPYVLNAPFSADAGKKSVFILGTAIRI